MQIQLKLANGYSCIPFEHIELPEVNPRRRPARFRQPIPSSQRHSPPSCSLTASYPQSCGSMGSPQRLT